MHFSHALKVREDICFGCSHCINACPTEAIRIKHGKASIYENRCIDCGECFTACPVCAIVVEQEDFKSIFNYKHRVAIIPSILLGQFKFDVSFGKIKEALIQIGFTDALESAAFHHVHKELTKEYLKENEDTKPLISPFCPAIVRLIQVKFPSLVDNIVLVKPAIDFTALHIRKKLMESGVNNDDIGVFYITPCAAKIAAIKSPVGEKKSEINGTINLNFIYNKIYKLIKNTPVLVSENREERIQKSILGSLSGGEASEAIGRSLAIDEIHNVIEFLEKVENEEIKDVNFLELRACDQSCAGGILTITNRFIASERLKNISKQSPENEHLYQEISDSKDFFRQHTPMEQIKPRSMLKLDENMARAMDKMEKARRLMCFLPGFDCGACGAPTCQALAEDIAQKSADISNCVFMQREMEKYSKLSAEHAYRLIEKVWGEGRLNKNCSKKGAKNES